MSDLDSHRERVRAFIAEQVPVDWAGIGAVAPQARAEFRTRWRQALAGVGFIGLGWPREYGGGGFDAAEQAIVHEEMARAGLPLLPLTTDGFSVNLIGQTILHWGTEEQKTHFLPRIVSGEDRWCQGYSEPEAGSDLFSLRTRAVSSGDEWVINGQKTWQTAGMDANWIFVLVRTGALAERGRGLSMLLVPLDQPGIEVRPIMTMTGHAEFTEVFFTDARTAAANIVGPVGEGGRVAVTLLGFERAAGSMASYLSHRIELARLARLAQEYGVADDTSMQERLGWCSERVELLGMMARRMLAAIAIGNAPGAESSVLKLFISEYHSRATELAVDILGTDAALLTGEGAVSDLGPDPLGSPNTPRAWLEKFMVSRAATIYGGSSEIQRTTLGERVLGLPRAGAAQNRPASTFKPSASAPSPAVAAGDASRRTATEALQKAGDQA